ncbi:MAG: cytochrome c [Hyphomicrobiales bacterium]|nr:MAG: cytochrome c [Hyphomicrobiales bacterium]
MVVIAASFFHVRPLRGQGPLDQVRKTELENLVRQDCGSCHGMTMKGGLGRSLLPERLREADRDGLAAIILDGIPGTPMPPWRGLLTEAEAAWIAGRLQEGLAK